MSPNLFLHVLRSLHVDISMIFAGFVRIVGPINVAKVAIFVNFCTFLTNPVLR